MVVGNTGLGVFLLLGNLASDAPGVRGQQSRVMMRTLIRPPVWNVAAMPAVSVRPR